MTDIICLADGFRLGADPTPDDVSEANWLIDRLSAEIVKMRAAPKVKPLEWAGLRSGLYEIICGTSRDGGVFSAKIYHNGIRLPGAFDTAKEAKAAANNHHERITLEALE